MKTKLEVLATNLKVYGPLCLYSDACAAIGKLEDEIDRTERLRAAAVKRCEELIKELHQTARAQEIITTSRWDTLPKAL